MERPRLPSLPELVHLTAAEDSAGFDHLRELFRGLTQPSVPWDAAVQLAPRLDIDAAASFRLLEAALWLYEQARGWGDAWQARLAELVRNLPNDPPIDTSRVVGRLESLCAPIEARERARQRYWLQHGILTNGVAFSSFVDLRPSFTAAKDAVDEMIPVVIIRVHPDEGPPAIFQLTESSVGELRTMVDEIERKLATLRAHGVLAPMLMPKGAGDVG